MPTPWRYGWRYRILASRGNIATVVLVYAVVDDSLSQTSPLGDAIETFVRCEDAERFVEEVRGDDPELGAKSGFGPHASRARPTSHAHLLLAAARNRPIQHFLPTRWLIEQRMRRRERRLVLRLFELAETAARCQIPRPTWTSTWPPERPRKRLRRQRSTSLGRAYVLNRGRRLGRAADRCPPRGSALICSRWVGRACPLASRE
jgi:hypothetical protein